MVVRLKSVYGWHRCNQRAGPDNLYGSYYDVISLSASDGVVSKITNEGAAVE